MGSEKARKPRTIVGKFHHYSDRELIRQKAYDNDVRKALKEANMGVGIQRPQQTRGAGKAFYEIMREQERQGNTVNIISNKLTVNNSLYKVYSDGKVCDQPRFRGIADTN